ncbi:uncharacterized protein LOC120766586 isoform X3 [Bactrocera tryoni]|uniref:uncharacterized protein LOC120766586 isoform X3 n=1 Tax=Bactrocera tryoni TaxID=59916 RepID=UPI001A973D08|nr:uncharacterized protein LOC120766586 isoform X3 [Bactrocera tryoni]
MFGCIYQLWDWLDAPPLFNGATMDAKKLQQLQQANAQKKLPLAYQTNLVDYRAATHSPVFQQQQQQAAMSAYHSIGGSGYQQSPTATSSSGGPLTPIDMQPQPNKMLLKHMAGSGGNTSSSSHSSPYHQSSYNSGGEQLYQSPTERTYLTAAGRLQATSAHNPATALQQQYQQLQQAKLQAQLQTQSEAVQQQQRTFAMRQAMNPPVPQGHFHMSQSSSIMSTMTLQQQQQQQQQQQLQQNAAAAVHGRAPPSTLNLNSQYQPAGGVGPLKVNQKQTQQQQQHYHTQDQQQIYAQHQQQHQLQLQLQHQQQLQQQQQQHAHHQQQQQQQRLKSEQPTPGSEQSPVYIQQNHPGHVVNQACQTQISAVKGSAVVQKTTPSSEDSSSKSPSHAPLDRKKSIGSMQALKSPITKRPPTSPVTLSGWLYKQGSDGLKVWRKRWFVLAEYCLYYYKGPEEEKLLGSILLPSYKVSACLPEDKIYRKYAFKCEHQNMRTYWLAAETGESMMQWVRALTAATNMQAPNSGESDQPSGSSSLNHSGENSDSGIHTLQSQQSKMSLNQGQVTPASENANVNSASSSNSGGVGGGGGAQPLYANAPPKPRRINDGGYSSPSPEHSIDNERKPHHQQQQAGRHSGLMSPTLQQMQQQQQQHHHQRGGQQPQQHHAIYDTRTGNVSSALRLQQAQQQFSVDQLEAQLQQQMALSAEDYPKSPPPPATHSNYMELEEQMLRLQQQQQRGGEEIYGERDLYMQKLIQQRYPPHLALYPNAERRTPDAYGRSKNRIFSDYEDIYNLTQAGMATSAQEALLQEAASYRRPLSPPSYDGSKHVPAMPMRYTPNHMEAAQQQQLTASNSNLRSRQPAAIVRPHSADFLEYEARAESAAAAAATAGTSNLSNAIKPDAVRAPRPKSSLDINRTPDSFYYSEASYAEKMRKSALYLQHPKGATNAQPQQAGGYRTTGDFLSPVGSGMHTIGYENPYERAYKRGEQLHDGQGAASMPRMSRSNTTTAMNTSSLAHLRSQSMHPQTQALLSPQSQSQQKQQQPPPPQKPVYTPTMSTQQIIQQSEQFLRSASARLPKRSGGFDDDYNSATTTSPPQQQQQQQQSSLQSSQSQSQSSSQSQQQQHQQHQHQPSAQDGERKREESMKRLLEWKQRMLQSPLTRKGMQQGGSNMSAMSKLGSNPNILLASTTVASGAHYAATNTSGGNSSGGNAVGGSVVAGTVGAGSGGITTMAAGGSLVGGVGGIQRSRSDAHANLGPAGYNSYSSDDEAASISVRNVRNLPKGNLTVKPDPSDAHNPLQQQQQQLQQQQHLAQGYDQMLGTLTNSYYGTAHDTKYAKTTTLTDQRSGFVGLGGGGGVGGVYGSNGLIAGGNSILAASTPLHPSANGGDYYGGVGGGAGPTLWQEQHTQQQAAYPMRRVDSRAEIDMLERETSTQMRNLDVSAGDLLSRTHEELVLLLIQLRRQNSNTARAIEQCCSDIHEVQNRLRTAEGLTRAESIQRLDYLKQHLLDLERQYEKSKPLVNLVDNMVKLGSLYRNNDINGRQPQRNEAVTLDRLEFNQRMQERRLLLEEQKQWDRLSPNHSELQSKVHQLYQLDQLLQEESGTLQNLQRDKEELERALGGLRARIQDTSGPPMALEAAKKQQHMLERELSRVHQLLAENSKKLEQTVAGNARLEQELIVLRQKLQASRGARGSQGALTNGVGGTDSFASNTTAMLESELKRVQTLVGDMQRQRQELSSAVRQLTENSNRLYQEIGNKENIANGLPLDISQKKRTNSASWQETDLDSMHSISHTLSDDSTLNLSTPLYVDTKLSDFNNGDELQRLMAGAGVSAGSYRYNDASDNLETSGVDSDGFLDSNPFANLTNQEKQEIKTVRIVKRESERRHRDRSERNGLSSSTQNLDQVLEEEQQLMSSNGLVSNGYQHMNGATTNEYQSNGRSKSLPRSYNEPPTSGKVRHHHHHSSKHSSKHNGHHNSSSSSKQEDYYSRSFDKNSNYAGYQLSNGANGGNIANGGHAERREHLNPLANAYFAKQLQQQQQHQHHHGHTRESSQLALRQKTDSVQSLNKSITDLSPDPVFQSEAARQIINELSAGSASEDNTEKIVEKVPSQHKHRRAVPREKRRHYTAPNNVNVKAMENVQAENDMNRNNTNWRARDDLDMDLALRPRMNAPDVVRSALGHGEKISENTIDNLLLAPNKIVIPERYIPEKTPELSPEEKKRRQEKVESIKKMLAEAPISTANDTTVSLPPSKINAEKKQREHLLQLNQILAQQVMQMSKIVAGNPNSQTNLK